MCLISGFKKIKLKAIFLLGLYDKATVILVTSWKRVSSQQLDFFDALLFACVFISKMYLYHRLLSVRTALTLWELKAFFYFISFRVPILIRLPLAIGP